MLRPWSASFKTKKKQLTDQRHSLHLHQPVKSRLHSRNSFASNSQPPVYASRSSCHEVAGTVGGYPKQPEEVWRPPKRTTPEWPHTAMAYMADGQPNAELSCAATSNCWCHATELFGRAIRTRLPGLSVALPDETMAQRDDFRKHIIRKCADSRLGDHRKYSDVLGSWLLYSKQPPCLGLT